jgi:hypothetical protein
MIIMVFLCIAAEEQEEWRGGAGGGALIIDPKRAEKITNFTPL